jgi:tRNA 2-selenouridine synthase
MGALIQPSQEQFENNLAYQLSKIDKHKPLWLEDESRTVGKCAIPNSLWNQMRKAPVIKLNIPLEERIRFLTQEYGKLDPNFLIECTQRIGKRLGPEQTRDTILAIHENRTADFIRLVLVYYDKTYKTGQSMREEPSIYEVAGTLAADISNVKPILEKAKTIQ